MSVFKVTGGDLLHKKIKPDGTGFADIVPGTLLYDTADGLITMASGKHLKDYNGLCYMSVDYYANVKANNSLGVVPVQAPWQAEIKDNHLGEAVALGAILTITNGKFTAAVTGDAVCAVVTKANSGTATTDIWEITAKCLHYISLS